MQAHEYNHHLEQAHAAGRAMVAAVVLNLAIIAAVAYLVALRPIGGCVVVGVVSTVLMMAANGLGARRGRAERALQEGRLWP